VTVESANRDVLISIRDSGKGIAAENLQKIFEPFYSTRPEGTGLGLAISRQIARAHGGEINVESSPRTGTTMIVNLPRAVENEVPSA